MRNVLRALAHRSVPGLTRLAAVLALVGLAMMCVSIVVPRPLPVVLAMSVGHAIGAAALGCYALAILLTMQRNPPPPPAPEPPASTPPPDAAPQDDHGAPP